MANSFFNIPHKPQVDGYTIDLSGGASTNQSLVYNGTAVVPTSIPTTSSVPQISWSAADYCMVDAHAIQAGSNTTGIQFFLTAASTITGARFYWPGGAGALTVKVSIWDNTSTRLTSNNIAVNNQGIYIVTFTSPQSYATPYKKWVISMWETSGTKFVESNSPDSTISLYLANGPSNAGPVYWIVKNDRYAAGDVVPTSGANIMSIDPTFTTP